MSLRDKNRGPLQTDDAVRRALASWSQERDSEQGRLNLKRAIMKLSDDQRRQLVERLAEISLGQLYVIDRED